MPSKTAKWAILLTNVHMLSMLCIGIFVRLGELSHNPPSDTTLWLTKIGLLAGASGFVLFNIGVWLGSCLGNKHKEP